MSKNATPSLAPSLLGLTYKAKCIILAVLSFCLYVNTLGNEYALDDYLVITDNQYVHQGFKGIKKILTSDVDDSYTRQMNGNPGLSGGRYRPLSIILFAVEQQFFGDSPLIRHFVNVVCYMLCILAMFYFLRNYLFKNLPEGEDCSFIAALLFALHPIHTEVVANAKGIDEILSLLFILLTFTFSLKHFETKKTKDLLIALACFFLALFSKEYAVTLIVLLPLLFYLLAGKTIKESIISAIPYYGIALVYLLLRFSAVGFPKSVPSNDILMNPYLFAAPGQKLATELFVLSKYLYMLFIPYPLACDYSYSQIPYHNLSDLSVWASVLLYIGIAIWGVFLLIKKNILAFPVLFYLANIALISNFVMDLGGTMGERLIFHSSFGFIVVIAYGLVLITGKLNAQTKKIVLASLLGLLLLVFGREVIKRNPEWKNDVSLFSADIHSAPNSFMVNSNLGANYIRLAQLPENSSRSSALVDSAMKYVHRSIVLHKTPYVNSILNMGIIYYLRGIPDSALSYCDTARKIFPGYPELRAFLPILAHQYLNKALALAQKGNVQEGIHELKMGLRADNNNPDVWYNLGGAYYTIKQFDSARFAWNAALTLKPDYDQAKQGLAALPPATSGVEIKGIK
ncbi:MAG TPA: tetratricopeptide repeat protein [Bacteroidia bacterium]|nr:tetratricopeptide repeat protein [Bacteroidia bacterium]